MAARYMTELVDYVTQSKVERSVRSSDWRKKISVSSLSRNLWKKIVEDLKQKSSCRFKEIVG